MGPVMRFAERHLSANRLVTLEFIDGIWVVCVSREFPNFVDILVLAEFQNQEKACAAYWSTK